MLVGSSIFFWVGVMALKCVKNSLPSNPSIFHQIKSVSIHIQKNIHRKIVDPMKLSNIAHKS